MAPVTHGALRRQRLDPILQDAGSADRVRPISATNSDKQFNRVVLRSGRSYAKHKPIATATHPFPLDVVHKQGAMIYKRPQPPRPANRRDARPKAPRRPTKKPGRRGRRPRDSKGRFLPGSATKAKATNRPAAQNKAQSQKKTQSQAQRKQKAVTELQPTPILKSKPEPEGAASDEEIARKVWVNSSLYYCLRSRVAKKSLPKRAAKSSQNAAAAPGNPSDPTTEMVATQETFTPIALDPDASPPPVPLPEPSTPTPASGQQSDVQPSTSTWNPVGNAKEDLPYINHIMKSISHITLDEEHDDYDELQLISGYIAEELAIPQSDSESSGPYSSSSSADAATATAAILQQLMRSPTLATLTADGNDFHQLQPVVFEEDFENAEQIGMAAEAIQELDGHNFELFNVAGEELVPQFQIEEGELVEEDNYIKVKQDGLAPVAGLQHNKEHTKKRRGSKSPGSSASRQPQLPITPRLNRISYVTADGEVDWLDYGFSPISDNSPMASPPGMLASVPDFPARILPLASPTELGSKTPRRYAEEIDIDTTPIHMARPFMDCTPDGTPDIYASKYFGSP